MIYSAAVIAAGVPLILAVEGVLSLYKLCSQKKSEEAAFFAEGQASPADFSVSDDDVREARPGVRRPPS